MTSQQTLARFYTLSLPLGSKSTGNVFPQCASLRKGYNHLSENSYRNLRHDNFPIFTPDLDYYVLDKGAKLTDFVSKGYPYFGFLMSNKVRNIFESFQLPEHRYYPTAIKNRTEINRNYSLFHFISDFSDCIDFSKTEFYLWDTFEASASFRFSDLEELRNKYQSISSIIEIRSKKIILKKDFHLNFDIFRLSFSDPRTYISHRLKTALEEAHITGIEIIPTDVI